MYRASSFLSIDNNITILLFSFLQFTKSASNYSSDVQTFLKCATRKQFIHFNVVFIQFNSREGPRWRQSLVSCLRCFDHAVSPRRSRVFLFCLPGFLSSRNQMAAARSPTTALPLAPLSCTVHGYNETEMDKPVSFHPRLCKLCVFFLNWKASGIWCECRMEYSKVCEG